MGRKEDLLLETRAREGIARIRGEVLEALALLSRRVEAVQSISGPLSAATHVMIGTTDSASIRTGVHGFDRVIVMIEKILEQKGASSLNKDLLHCLLNNPTFDEFTKVLQKLGLLKESQ